MHRLKKLTTDIISIALVSASLAGAAYAEQFKFAWPSAINSGVAPLTFAEKLGLFEKEGLELELTSLKGSGVIVPQLLAGTIDAAYSGLEPLIIARQPGKPNYDLLFAYNFIPSSIWEMVVLETSEIKSVSELEGKTIGVFSLGASNVFTTKAILQNEGVDPEQVNFLAVGVGAAAFEALKSGDIDVLNLFDTAHARLELSGTPLRVLDNPEGFGGSSHGVSVTRGTYENRPDLIAKFGRVLTQGNLACQANLEACIRSYWAAYPTNAPTAEDMAETMIREKAVLTKRLSNLLAADTDYGKFPEQDWINLIAALEAGGVVTNPDIPFDTLFSNKLVSQFNDFDKNALLSMAKEAN